VPEDLRFAGVLETGSSVKATRYLRSGESLIETPAKKSASTKR